MSHDRSRYAERYAPVDYFFAALWLLILFVCGQCLGATPEQKVAANAVCKVSTRDLSAPGEFAGSGVLIVDATRGIVLTAAHVVRGGDQSNVRCEWHSGESIQGRVINYNPGPDVAVIQLRSIPDSVLGVELRCQPIQPGDNVLFLGYAGGRTLVIRDTRILGHLGNSGVAQMTSEPGMSGGPVIDSEGKVIGPLWGSDFVSETMFATVAGRSTVLTANY